MGPVNASSAGHQSQAVQGYESWAVDTKIEASGMYASSFQENTGDLHLATDPGL